jgi:hypothetical protein
VKVNFVSRGGPHLASYRLRIAAPAEYLRMRGLEVVIGSFDPSADAHVFSKHWDAEDRLRAQESYCPVFDLCDDWFGREHDAHYRAMCDYCHVVVSSRRLGERVLEETHRLTTYIPEPYELPEGIIREPNENPKVLWFGHSSNLPTLAPYLDIPNLFVCTNATGRGVVPYTTDNLRRCLEYCDLVILPQDKDWKSANRMVEAIRAGRFVVGSDIPGYRGFHQYLGDIRGGLEWVSRNSGNIMPRIISGRDAITSFSPERVGEMWFDFISAVATRSYGATGT